MGSNGCYWKVDTDYQPPAWDTADQHQGETGAWFLFTCLGPFPGTGGGLVWLPTTGGPAAPPPPPEVLARQAVNQLDPRRAADRNVSQGCAARQRADMAVAGAIGMGARERDGVRTG